jgi:hypothetical protein
MKHIWIGILVLFALYSCDTENDLPFQLTAEGLIGTWEHYQSQGNTGGGDYWTPYEASGRTITFLPGGKFRSVDYFVCGEGDYTVADRTVTFLFDCEEEVPDLNYSLGVKEGDLVLSPGPPYMCIEGCSYIFKKIE